MKIKQLTNAEFKAFSEQFRPSSMYQTIQYAFTMNEEECDTFFLGLMDGNVLKAATLVLVQKVNGFKYALAPRGFLINFNDASLVEVFTKQIKKFLGKRDIVAIKINPLIIKVVYNKDGKVIQQNMYYDTIFTNLKKLGYYHLGYNNFFEALKPRFEAVVNIDLPYTQIFANIEKPFRTKIRKATKEGIKIYHGNINNLDYLYLQTKDKYPRDLDYFKDLYKFFDKENLIDFYYSKLDTTEYLKISQNLYAKYEHLSAELNKELINSRGSDDKIMNCKIAVDKEFEKCKKQLVLATNYLRDFPDGIILSSALVVKWQEEVYLVMDGYDEEYKKFNGKHLLLWKLMGRYSKLGFKKFNLGGISNIQKTNDVYKGLNEFKLSFNAKAIEYAGDFELITNAPLYFMYRKSANFSNMLKPGK
ncbi:MAG: peptidoglycan bridge formation glycyltransferase FemA/FemB family protein [Bacilli bacterium]